MPSRWRALFWAGIVAAALCLQPVREAAAATAGEIDSRVGKTLDQFYKKVGGAREVAGMSAGMLVFPAVVKAGLGVGGEYGEGALQVRAKTVDYYSTTAASVGLQMGVQERAVIIMFMTDDALAKFRKSAGWKVGVDGSVTLVTAGASGSVDTASINQPILGFVFGQKGLMFDVSLEGAKITKLQK